MLQDDNLDDLNLDFNDTGGSNIQYKIITIPFDKYLVKVKVTNTNKFISIEEIKIKKSFIEESESSKKFNDIEKYYED